MAKATEEDILLNQKIALRIKTLRESSEKTAAKFAELNAIDRQLLYRWENIENPRGLSIHTIRKFCDMAEISLKDFFDSELFG